MSCKKHKVNQLALDGAAYNNNHEYIKYLVKKGYKLKYARKGECPPMLTAIDRGHGDTVRVLLELGCDGTEYLYYCINRGLVGMLKVFAEDKKLLNTKTNGKTPLMYLIDDYEGDRYLYKQMLMVLLTSDVPDNVPDDTFDDEYYKSKS